MAISKIGSKALVDCSVAAVDIEDNSITSAKLAGSIANAKLANSSITVNGTSVSLGASGSIPAVSWQSVVTADGSTGTTAVAGNGYFIDTTSAAHTLTLPSSPSIGDTVAIKDYAGTFGTNNLTIARNSSNIQGVANDSLISTNRASLTLVYVDATKGWLYAVESNVADLVPLYITATGGTVTESGNFKIHTFTGDGCFVVSSTANPIGGPNNVDYLVVAGGGGGGACGGGGGGAGGYRESHSTPVSGPYTASPLATPTGLTVGAQTYPVTVGGGGTGAAKPAGVGSNGSNSVFSTITSAGGGGGGKFNGGPSILPACKGQTGGSGGGSGGIGPTSVNPGGSGNTPPVSPSQGNNGGTGQHIGGCTMRSGGGGGATTVGGNGTNQSPGAGSSVGGTGGTGTTTSITGSPLAYAGGGGGTGFNNASGCGTSPCGTGGTGQGRAAAASSGGTTNRGGGGGGGAHPGGGVNGGSAGGSGVVIIRYKFQ